LQDKKSKYHLKKDRKNIRKIKRSYKPHKPDSVFTLSFICGKHYCLPVAAYPVPCTGLTPALERAALITVLYVALQHPRFTRYLCCHKRPWALTSHFHLCHA